MISKYESFTQFADEYSVSDARIDSIVCTDTTVQFVFAEGFYVKLHDKIRKFFRGYIELGECCADEFSCYIVQREATLSGAKLQGEPVSLAELSRLLYNDKRKLEIFLELYKHNYLHWRAVLLPIDNDGLSDHVVIETAGYFPLTVFMEATV